MDEKIIHAMMAGDVPGMRQDGETPRTEESPADAERPEESVTNLRPRKRREQKGYGEIFLEKLAPMPRKHTYISIEMYNELSDILPVIARGVSIPTFLENMLRHHFETYRDEIFELYESKTKKRY